MSRRRPPRARRRQRLEEPLQERARERREGGINQYRGCGGPRYYLAQRVVTADSEAETFAALQEGKGEAAVVPGGMETDLSRVRPGGSVVVAEAGLQKVICFTNSSSPGLLTVADAYYPGWRAFVNGREVKISRVNHGLRGVVVPAGQTEVTFVYLPWSFRAGLWAALVSVVLAAGAGIFSRTRRCVLVCRKSDPA
jgi:hypothetical protein